MTNKRPPSESEGGANFTPPRPTGRGGKGGRGAVFERLWGQGAGGAGQSRPDPTPRPDTPTPDPTPRPDPPTPRPEKAGEGYESGMRAECVGEEKP